MYDHEKSDPAIVAVKPTNKAGQPAAELVEPRAGAEGNVSQQSTGRAQYRGTVSQALERIRQAARQRKNARNHGDEGHPVDGTGGAGESPDARKGHRQNNRAPARDVAAGRRVRTGRARARRRRCLRRDGVLGAGADAGNRCTNGSRRDSDIGATARPW